jgi:hypothetical protein
VSNDVFANGREIACKAGSGVTPAAFPDVCMTPPENPATPPGVPVPYPNVGKSGDTTDGSRSVQISGKEIMLKNKSYFKSSSGDEAGCAAKKGVVTSVNRGKVYFTAWSMDVKAEGENVVRHLDLTTHNHASPLTNTPPFPHLDSAAFASLEVCETDKKKMEEACAGQDPCPGVLGSRVGEQREQVSLPNAQRAPEFQAHAGLMSKDASRTANAAAASTAEADGSACVKAARCYLRPYEPGTKQDGCCPGQTPHHVPPKACFSGSSGYKGSYSPSSALCVCLEGASQHLGSHGKNHAAIEYLADQKGIKPGKSCDLKSYNELCAATVEAQCGCDKGCIEAQLNQSLKDKGVSSVKHVDTNSSAPLSDGLKSEIHESAGLPPITPTSS